LFSTVYDILSQVVFRIKPYTMQEEKRSNITVGVAGHFAGSTIYALHA
jgi:hypothetical protein